MKMYLRSFCGVIFLFSMLSAVAQRDQLEVQITQPSELTYIRLICDRYHVLSGQQYTIKIQNLTDRTLHVKAQLVAVLVCGNEVSTKFDIVLKPGETKGGSDFLGDITGMTGIVFKENCTSPEVSKDEKGNDQYNRIKSLSLRGYSAKIEKSEEEKEQEREKAKQERNAKEEAKKKEKQQAEQAAAEKAERANAEADYKQQKKEQAERATQETKQRAIENNAIMSSVGMGIFQIWDLFQSKGNNHEYENICSHFSVDMGLNLTNMPLVLNESTSYSDKVGKVYKTESKTTSDNPVYTNVVLGLNYYPLLSNKLSVGFHSRVATGPSFEAIAGGGGTSQIGTSTLIYTAHGYDLIFNGGTDIQIGRFLASLDFTRKKWEYSTSSDFFDSYTGDGSFSFATGSSQSKTVRYGAGFRLLKHENKMNIDLMILLDNLDYYNNQGSIFKSPIIFRASLWNHAIGKINAEFSPSYPVAGVPLNSINTLFKPHFSVDLLLNITRFTPHEISFSYENIAQCNERRGELVGYVDYSSLKFSALDNRVTGIGINLKSKKVLNSPKRENYIDFQMAAGGSMIATQNEFNDNEIVQILHFSPDIRFTKKIVPALYLGIITGLNSLSIRNTIPFYDANVIFDSQHYFLQGSFGATLGLMYSKKKTLILNYYFRPSIIGKGSQKVLELEMAYRHVYFNFSYLKMPDYNVGYVYERNMSIIKLGIGCRMPW